MIPGPLDTRLYRLLYGFVPDVFTRFYRMRVKGVEHVPLSGPVLLASNHLSNLDPVLLGVACPRQVHFMAKAELWKVPGVGPLVESLGSFPVHRGEADREAIRQGLEVLRAGEILGIFPEGHRQPEGRLGLPAPGVAFFGLQPGVTTIPVGITGSSGVWAGWRPGRPTVTVSYGPPVCLDLGDAPRSERQRLFAKRLMTSLAELLGQTPPPELAAAGSPTSGAPGDRART